MEKLHTIIKRKRRKAMSAIQRKRERKRTRSLQTNNLQSNSGKKQENSQWRENNQKFQFHSLFFAVCLHIFHLSCTQLHCSHFSHTSSISLSFWFALCILPIQFRIFFHLFRFSTFGKLPTARVCERVQSKKNEMESSIDSSNIISRMCFCFITNRFSFKAYFNCLFSQL